MLVVGNKVLSQIRIGREERTYRVVEHSRDEVGWENTPKRRKGNAKHQLSILLGAVELASLVDVGSGRGREGVGTEEAIWRGYWQPWVKMQLHEATTTTTTRSRILDEKATRDKIASGEKASVEVLVWFGLVWLWLVGWLVSWWDDWSVGCWIEGWIGELVDWTVCKLIGWLILQPWVVSCVKVRDRMIGWYTGKENYRVMRREEWGKKKRGKTG